MPYFVVNENTLCATDNHGVAEEIPHGTILSVIQGLTLKGGPDWKTELSA